MRTQQTPDPDPPTPTPRPGSTFWSSRHACVHAGCPAPRAPGCVFAPGQIVGKQQQDVSYHEGRALAGSSCFAGGPRRPKSSAAYVNSCSASGMPAQARPGGPPAELPALTHLPTMHASEEGKLGACMWKNQHVFFEDCAWRKGWLMRGWVYSACSCRERPGPGHLYPFKLLFQNTRTLTCAANDPKRPVLFQRSITLVSACALPGQGSQLISRWPGAGAAGGSYQADARPRASQGLPALLRLLCSPWCRRCRPAPSLALGRQPCSIPHAPPSPTPLVLVALCILVEGSG